MTAETTLQIFDVPQEDPLHPQHVEYVTSLTRAAAASDIIANAPRPMSVAQVQQRLAVLMANQTAASEPHPELKLAKGGNRG
jgi:hypothetical protein